MNLILPAAALVFFTFLFSAFMLFTRINSVRKKEMSGKYFKTFSEGEPSLMVLKTQRHYSNLFELPVIYYFTILVALIIGANSQTTVLFAWLFVVARVCHAIIHITSNHIYRRLSAFLIGWVAIIGMWTQIIDALPL